MAVRRQSKFGMRGVSLAASELRPLTTDIDSQTLCGLTAVAVCYFHAAV